MNTGIDRISAERKRQVEEEGWTPEHDAQHARGELAAAAACYAMNKAPFLTSDLDHIGYCVWPWDRRWDKRKKHDRIRSLTIAGALIAAEIDRLLLSVDGPAVPARSIGRWDEWIQGGFVGWKCSECGTFLKDDEKFDCPCNKKEGVA